MTFNQTKSPTAVQFNFSGSHLYHPPRSDDLSAYLTTVNRIHGLEHGIKIHIEGPLTSEALKFLSSRMSHYACWPPFS